jgi:peroxiredoxin
MVRGIILLSIFLILSCEGNQREQQDTGAHGTIETKKQETSGLEVGVIAPEFSLPTPDGETISLSDFRGRYLYVDFWASWCRPCRLENPELVEVYKKFQGEDFEILGVSLDRIKDAWVNAIEEDGLPWVHVSDLKYFDSELIPLYNIKNVPTTYLLDPEGKIVAKNTHPQQLAELLQEVL